MRRRRDGAAPGLIRPPPPPHRFGGAFLTDPASLAEASGGRGPVHIRPVAVLRPGSTDDVVRAVTWARELGIPLVPRGGATGMPGGNVGSGAVLDLTALNDITPEAGHRLDCGAGAIAARVEARARSLERRLPWLPSSAPWCTLGGMVACDAAGARSFGHGPTHAHLAWLEVVRADGVVERLEAGRVAGAPWSGLRDRLVAEVGDDIRTGWPKVRKNASGYALDRFLPGSDAVQLACGSEGTLAVVTRVGLATLPPIEARMAVLLGLPDVGALGTLVAEAHRLGAAACELFGARLLDFVHPDGRMAGLQRGAGVLLLEFEGESDRVEVSAEAARSLGREFGGAVLARTSDDIDALWAIRHDASPAIARAARGRLRSLQFMEDGVVPFPRVGAYLEGVDSILTRHGTDGVVFGHAGDGNLHVNPLVDMANPDWKGGVRSMLEDAVELVTDEGGTLSGEHGDGRLRAPHLERVWGSRLAGAFRIVKDALDPGGVLNPGVVIPIQGQDPLEGFAAGLDLQVTARRPE